MNKKNVLTILFLGVAFTYGFIVGKMEVFPYEFIRYIYLINAGINSNIISSHYDLKIDLYKSYLGNNKYKIVMIGDSLTENCRWNELLNRDDIINRGIRGDTTVGILNRLDTINPGGIKKGLLMAGINDLYKHQNIQNVFERYVDIISYLKKSDIQPFIQSTLYTGKNEKHHKILNKKIKRLNILLERFSKEHNIVFINLNSRLSENQLLIDDYTKDGVHLNAFGYKIWRDMLHRYL